VIKKCPKKIRNLLPTILKKGNPVLRGDLGFSEVSRMRAFFEEKLCIGSNIFYFWGVWVVKKYDARRETLLKH